MKKRILIINKSFELGGIQMALANMLGVLSKEYDVTLAVFYPRGPLLERVPANVKLLKLSPLTETLGMKYEDCKKYGTFGQKLFKYVGSIWSKVFGNTAPVAFALAFQKNVGEYDAVISYHQETSARTLVSGFGKFALTKCNAKKRIAWVHADFLATKLATPKNEKTYNRFDKIICVSKTSAENFAAAYPSLRDKCDYCYNYLPVAEIIEKGNREYCVFERAEGDVILFSACRLHTEKGLLPALENLTPLFKEKKNLKWYIAGTGPEESALKRFIGEKELEKQVRLLGFKDNPYPYMKEADYLFLPSVHETFSMVVGEAHILGTPVIASDIPIMREVLGEHDHLCTEFDYRTVVEKIMQNPKEKALPDITQGLAEWTTQFERALKC